MFIPVIIFFSLWFVLTVMNQFKNASYRKYISRIDICRLLPLWTFFAPNPGVTDYHLLYRIKEADGTILPFTNVLLRTNKTIVNAVWNPTRRNQKALNDFVQEIRKIIQIYSRTQEDPQLLKISIPYISIIHYCACLAGSNPGASIQFTIIESFGHIERFEPRLVFNSDFHPLCA